MEPPFNFAYNIEGEEFGSLAGWCVSDYMALVGTAGMGGPLPGCLLTPEARPLSISLSLSPWCLTLWGLSAWLGLLTTWSSEVAIPFTWLLTSNRQGAKAVRPAMTRAGIVSLPAYSIHQ